MICIIPYYNRPAFLHYCLVSISRAKIPKGLHFHFQVDYGYNPQGLEIIDQFKFSKTVTFTQRLYKKASKLSYNILSAYLHNLNHNFVFMIEDDVIIEDDFFDWHLSQHDKNKDILATIGSVAKPQITPPYDYQSWGVCFRGTTLKKHIKPHIVPQYFRYPELYLSNHFPGSKLGNTQTQQQGLIRRVAETIPCIFPGDNPHCHNIGFASLQVGYLEFLNMPIKSQIQAIGLMVNAGGLF